jgi:NADH-quinone oxidoreductase subunit M
VGQHLISWMIFLPLMGAVLQALLPERTVTSPSGSADLGVRAGFRVFSGSQWAALGTSLASALIGFVVLASLRSGTPEMQFSELTPWIGAYAISYDMGIDGLNAPLVLLICIIFPLLLASEWSRAAGRSGIHGLLLLLQGAFMGAVCAQDLFLLFFFWALTAVPFYFLIGIWGGPERERAAFHSIVTSSIGNGLFFAALVLVYYAIDPHTFSIRELMGGKLAGRTFVLFGSELPVSAAAFGLIAVGLALRAPIWPTHGWFLEVAEEAPASVFVALGAVAVPVSASIFMRLGYSLFSDTVVKFADTIVVVGVCNLVMGIIGALAQRGLRRLLAFICIAELGLLLIGTASLKQTGAVGAVYQQLALGLSIAGFGLFTGILVQRTGQERFLLEDGSSAFGGIATRAPGMAVVAGVVVASLLGLPGLGGFVSHSLLIIGSYEVYPVAVLAAGGAVVLATYTLFTMYRHVFLGKPHQASQAFQDLTALERAFLLPIVAALLVVGLYPKPLIELVMPTVQTLLSTFK